MAWFQKYVAAVSGLAGGKGGFKIMKYDSSKEWQAHGENQAMWTELYPTYIYVSVYFIANPQRQDYVSFYLEHAILRSNLLLAALGSLIVFNSTLGQRTRRQATTRLAGIQFLRISALGRPVHMIIVPELIHFRASIVLGSLTSLCLVVLGPTASNEYWLTKFLCQNALNI